jgi:hypothetical protein
MCKSTATFVKTLFTDPVNSETTVYRERERKWKQNTIHQEKDEIVLFTTRSYFVSQMCISTATFVKIFFTDPVNSKTTVYRERESGTDFCVSFCLTSPLYL